MSSPGNFTFLENLAVFVKEPYGQSHWFRKGGHKLLPIASQDDDNLSNILVGI